MLKNNIKQKYYHHYIRKENVLRKVKEKKVVANDMKSNFSSHEAL